MNCDRRLFILSLVLSVGLASSSVHADYSVTEICAGTFKSEGAFLGFNADTVVINVMQPDPFGTTPAEVRMSQTFCTFAGGPGACERNGEWSGAFGDDFPLNGLGPVPAVDCDYRFGPGKFESLDTVADMSGMDQFCMVVTNCDNNAVFVRVLIFTSLAKNGVALTIREISQSPQRWIDPGDAETVCINFNNAEVQPTFVGGQSVNNTENVTGIGFETGALTPFTETRSECLDDDDDNDFNDCRNARPTSCGDCDSDDYLNRESDNVFVKLEQPRPEFELLDKDLVYCNSSTMTATISNEGTGATNVSDVEILGADSGDFEIISPLPFVIPAGDTREFAVRYNNREPREHHVRIRFESNALDKDSNTPLDHSLAEHTLHIHAFSTLSQVIVTQQDSAIQFRAYIQLNISELAPTGKQLIVNLNGDTGEGSEGLVAAGPSDCGKVTQIPSIGSRVEFDPTKIMVTNVTEGRPSDEPNGAATGVDTVEPPVKALPGFETDNSDPPLNVRTFWTPLFFTALADANTDGRIDMVMGDLGGTVIVTQDCIDEGPIVDPEGNPHVIVEAACVSFELLSLTGCNTASVRFVRGSNNNFFPDGHQSNVGSNPDIGTTILQDVGANSASNLGIPPNSFVRGDVDFNATMTANDPIRTIDVILNTDGSRAQVAVRIGQDCVAAVDITVDMSIDIRDFLTSVQLLFNLTSTITPSDILPLWDEPTNQNDASPVGWPNPGYELLVDDSDGDQVLPHPNRFPCPEGLNCDQAGVVVR